MLFTTNSLEEAAMAERIDAELDAVCGGHHHHGHHEQNGKADAKSGGAAVPVTSPVTWDLNANKKL
jgi:hypothetical protein